MRASATSVSIGVQLPHLRVFRNKSREEHALGDVAQFFE
jgi:hypothetical protein